MDFGDTSLPVRDTFMLQTVSIHKRFNRPLNIPTTIPPSVPYCAPNAPHPPLLQDRLFLHSSHHYLNHICIRIEGVFCFSKSMKRYIVLFRIPSDSYLIVDPPEPTRRVTSILSPLLNISLKFSQFTLALLSLLHPCIPYNVKGDMTHFALHHQSRF